MHAPKVWYNPDYTIHKVLFLLVENYKVHITLQQSRLSLPKKNQALLKEQLIFSLVMRKQ
jgi:hypothetical protein